MGSCVFRPLAVGLAVVLSPPALGEAGATAVTGYSLPERSPSAPGRLVAKRKKKKKKRSKRGKKKTSPSKSKKSTIVRVKSPAAAVKLKDGRKKHDVFVVTASAPISLEMTGPGKLALVMSQILPRKKTKSLTVTVGIDLEKIRNVSVSNRVNKKSKLLGGPHAKKGISKNNTFVETLSAGAHIVDINAADAEAGVLVRIEYYPSGKTKPVANVHETPSAMSSLAAALGGLDDDEGGEASLGGLADSLSLDDDEGEPAPEPPKKDLGLAALALDLDDDDEGGSEPAAAPASPDPDPDPTPAAPVAAAPEPKKQTLAEEVTEKIASGELRDGLLSKYPKATVAGTDGGEGKKFHRVKSEESFSILAQGPGELTVRLHPLLEPDAPDADSDVAPPPQDFTVVIIENDVVLQQLSGQTKPSTAWEAPKAKGKIKLSEPREYKLKIGPKKSKVAFQITQLQSGMVATYEFAAEKLSLAAMALGLDDDEDGLGMGGASMPTVVMEVDLSERVVVQESRDVVGLAISGTAVLPHTGGVVGVGAFVGVRFRLPLDLPGDTSLILGVEGGFVRHGMSLDIPDFGGNVIRSTSSFIAVPMMGQVGCHLPLGDMLQIYASVAAGVVYENSTREALDAIDTQTKWAFGGRGTAGLEIDIGTGMLGPEVSYLLVLRNDFGNTLRDYTPGGLVFGVHYRIGM